MKDLKTLRVEDLLPSSLAQDSTVKSVAQVCGVSLHDVAERISQTLIYSRINELDDATLDDLAWQFHVDLYDSGQPKETRVQLIRESLIWHRFRGTPYSVEMALRPVFGRKDIKEWYEYSGKPYYFKLLSEMGKTAPEDFNAALQRLEKAKNLRSWLERVDHTTKGLYYFFCSQNSHEREVLSEETQTVTDGSFSLFIGFGTTITNLVDIRGAEPLMPVRMFQYGYAAAGQYDREVLNAGNE